MHFSLALAAQLWLRSTLTHTLTGCVCIYAWWKVETWNCYCGY